MASFFPELEQVMAAGPAILMPLMVFSGLYVQLPSLGWWFRWISYISPIRWGYSSLIQNEMRGLEFDCNADPRLACTRTGEQQLAIMGLNTDPSIGYEILILAGIFVGFIMLAFTFMWRTTRKK